MVELRGIIIDKPKGIRRVRLLVRSERGDDYETKEYPSGKKLNKSAIIKFLSDTFECEKKDVVIAHHVKIPLEK